MESGFVTDVLNKNSNRHGGLIAILEDVQARYGYLPKEVLGEIAKKTNKSLVDIYGVATFYRSFRLEPIGKHSVSVCRGTACHVRGAPTIAKEFEKQLKIKAGETTEDKEFTLETVNCLGACALGPIVVSDGHYFSNVKIPKVEEIINETQSGLDNIEVKTDKRIFPVEVSCPRCNRHLMDQIYLIEGYPSIRVTVSFGNKHGWMRLSSLYGSHKVESEYEVLIDTILDFFCPYCHTELRGASECADCSAPVVPMIIRGGGILQICSRRGCNWHLLDLG